MFVLETERLKITIWAKRDLHDAISIWGDAKVMEHIDIRGGLNRKQVEDKLNQEIELQERFKVQYWKVLLKKTNTIIGCCGLKPHDISKKVYELGFHFGSNYWGLGYAHEAAKGVIQYGFADIKAAKIYATHSPNNLAAKEILIKLGFKKVGEKFYDSTNLNHPAYELVAPQ